MNNVFAVDLSTVFSPGMVINQPIVLVNVILKNAFTIAGIIAFVLLIFAGFRFIVAAGGGEAKEMEQAKKAITSTLLGLILIIASVWIIQIIETITGLKIFNY